MSGLTRDGTAKPIPREKQLGANGDRKTNVFPVRLTPSRNGNHSSLTHYFLRVMTKQTYLVQTKKKYIHAYTYIHTLISPWEDKCEWHRMTRMTGPDWAVMVCNLINIHTYIHAYIHTYT